MRIVFVAFVFLLFQGQVSAQHIHGVIKGELTRYVSNAVIEATCKGDTVTTTTDTLGQFDLAGHEYGFYELRITSDRYDTFLITNIYVTESISAAIKTTLTRHTATYTDDSGKSTRNYYEFESSTSVKYTEEGKECSGDQRVPETFCMVDGRQLPVLQYLPPLIETCYCICPTKVEEIGFVYPTISLLDLVSTIGGVYQARRGDLLRFFGCRPEGVLYIVDGVQIARR